MKTYSFKVVVEPDGERWFARCPALEHFGAATWGHTEQDAMERIRELVEMVVDELCEDGIPIPEGPAGDVEVSAETRVAVTV